MEIEREKKKMAKNALVADSPVMVAPYAPIFPQHALNTYFIWCPFVCAPVIFFSVSLVHYSSLSLFSSVSMVAMFIRPFCQPFIADATGCYRYYYCLHKLFPKDFYFIA